MGTGDFQNIIFGIQSSQWRSEAGYEYNIATLITLVCPYWFKRPDRKRDPPCGSGRSVCHEGVCRYIVPEGATRMLLDGVVGEAYRDLSNG